MHYHFLNVCICIISNKLHLRMFLRKYAEKFMGKALSYLINAGKIKFYLRKFFESVQESFCLGSGNRISLKQVFYNYFCLYKCSFFVLVSFENFFGRFSGMIGKPSSIFLRIYFFILSLLPLLKLTSCTSPVYF